MTQLPAASFSNEALFVIAVAVGLLLSILKPFIEKIPFARPSSDLHDATLILTNVLLVIGAVLYYAATLPGALSFAHSPQLVIDALYIVLGNTGAYHVYTKSAGKNRPSATIHVPVSDTTTTAIPAPRSDLPLPTVNVAQQVAQDIQNAIAQHMNSPQT